LAGGVTGECQGQVVGQDTGTVVHDPDEVRAALFDFDVDAAAAGVHGVLKEFLDHAGGPLDDLARGDLGDDRGRQLVDAGYGVVSHEETIPVESGGWRTVC